MRPCDFGSECPYLAECPDCENCLENCDCGERCVHGRYHAEECRMCDEIIADMEERLDTDDPGPRLSARSREPLRPDENR